MPWRVYRPAVVVGHSETGAMDKVDGPYYFFPLIKRLRDTAAGLAAAGRRRPRRHQRGAGRLRRQGDGPPRAPARPRRRGLPPGQPRAAADRRAGQRLLPRPPRRRSSRCPSTAASPGVLPTALLPRAAAARRRCSAALLRTAPGAAAARPDHRPARHPARGARARRRSRRSFDSRRTEKALAGSGISVPRPRVLRRARCGPTGRSTSTTSTARDAAHRRGADGQARS